jgi:ribokinase
MRHFCVLGSLNMDMVTRVSRFARPGETLSGISFTVFSGGKGGNQAIGLAKLGAHVKMVGALGDDDLGDRYWALLKDSGVGIEGVRRLSETSTGTATIEVNGEGENHIIVVPGANAKVSPEMALSNRGLIAESAALLLQLEIPLETVLTAAAIAHAAGVPVILDPAPAQALPAKLYEAISILTPNETEAQLLTGINTDSEEGLEAASRVLAGRGAETVVIKAGARGAFLLRDGTFEHIPGFAVRAIDTVAAGDSFNAALAFAIGQGNPIGEAIRLANAAGALSTTKEGAQSAMPTMADALDFLNGDKSHSSRMRGRQFP